MTLNGEWKLYYAPEGEYEVSDIRELSSLGIPCISATVPGNVELGLSRAGILPEDLFKGMNITLAEKYEIYEWWYEKSFTAEGAPDKEHRAVLHFGAVDCYAEYYLNGERIGMSDNALIAQDFDVTDKLRYGEENVLTVHISSALIRGGEETNELFALLNSWCQHNVAASPVRKAPHCYGWDIMPRALSAGIWRDVEIRYEERYGFKYLYFNLTELNGESAEISFAFDTRLKPKDIYCDHEITVEGECREHSFKAVLSTKASATQLRFSVDGLKLWWPKNYGEANMYDLTVTMTRKDSGEILAKKTVRRGFRLLKLVHSEKVEEGGAFEFIINNKRIMAVGSNWVPMDVYHSRDKERYARALELADEVGCNILRCWGGNVYEDHEFFDFCCEHGIMVWQDFSMACCVYPQSDDFKSRLTKEVEWVINEYRDKACIVLWSGDNEVDQAMASMKANPDEYTITRELLPSITKRLDPKRPYLPSSPYMTGEVARLGRNYYAEDHLWGPRDYYKSPYYTTSKAYFVSETGYHGCPSRRSIEKFIDKEFVWPYFNNEQWNLHSTDQNNNPARVMLMHKQVEQIFDEVPSNLDDYALASQISQAEAKKFFVERVRKQMSRMGGVIWWNLMDGWPQMSDAVVDYYYEKKLAFDYIKRSSKPFMIMLDEFNTWGHDVVCANSTLSDISGSVRVRDIDSGRVLFEKNFSAKENSNTTLGKIELRCSKKGMLLIEWWLDNGEHGVNTYLYGTPPYRLDDYKRYLDEIKKAEE